MVQTWLNGRLAAGDSPRKVQVMRTVLSSVLTRAMREELVSRNVARLATVAESSPRRVRAWSDEEARAFLAASRDHPFYAAFVLLLFLGLRRGEALGLAWEDIDFDAGEIHVRRQLQRVGGGLRLGQVKTHAGRRTLPLLGVVRAALKEQSERQEVAREAAGDDWTESGLVITTQTGGPVEPLRVGRLGCGVAVVDN
jgi:integrase